MYDLLDASLEGLPADKPRYMMGVGSPEDLVVCAGRGVDMFDCVLPTRIARNGALFTAAGRLNLRNASCREDPGPIEEGCDCWTCRTFSLAYLHHLHRVEETLGLRLSTIHNLRFLVRLMDTIRARVREGTYAAFQRAFLDTYKVTDQAIRRDQKAHWIAAQRRKNEDSLRDG